jgi:hypothetical protein
MHDDDVRFHYNVQCNQYNALGVGDYMAYTFDVGAMRTEETFCVLFGITRHELKFNVAMEHLYLKDINKHYLNVTHLDRVSGSLR